MRSAAKSQVGRRYANALASLTNTMEEFQAVEADLEAFARLLQEQTDLRSALYHPGLGKEKRIGILDRVLKMTRPKSELSVRFLRLLVQRRRLEFLQETISAWREMVEERLGVVSAEIVTAVPMTEAYRDRCRETLEKITGRKVRLTARTDPNLIGGVRTRIGSQVYDGSILRQLDHLRDNFVEG
jgi:F-type H+-transporting ATPase subunit delta